MCVCVWCAIVCIRASVYTVQLNRTALGAASRCFTWFAATDIGRSCYNIYSSIYVCINGGLNRNFSCFSLCIQVYGVVSAFSTSITLFFSIHSIPSHPIPSAIVESRGRSHLCSFYIFTQNTQNSHLILINCCSQLICLHALAPSLSFISLIRPKNLNHKTLR